MDHIARSGRGGSTEEPGSPDRHFESEGARDTMEYPTQHSAGDKAAPLPVKHDYEALWKHTPAALLIVHQCLVQGVTPTAAAHDLSLRVFVSVCLCVFLSVCLRVCLPVCRSVYVCV